MHLGKNESLSKTNGGAIANTGFIVGEESVLVIDAGPSYLYALEMIKFIQFIKWEKILQNNVKQI